MDNSYPTPVLCDALSWRDLRDLVARLYRDLDNANTLIASLRADVDAALHSVLRAKHEWPGADTEYSIHPVCDDCGKPGKLITTPGVARVCRDCYMGENYTE